MWNNLTVGKYQELNAIITDETYDLEIDRQTHLLSALFGKPVEYYEALPIAKFQELAKQTAFLHTGDIPVVAAPHCLCGKKYKVIYDFRKLAAGQFIDALSLAKDPEEKVPNMHRMLAAISRSTKRTLTGRRVLTYGAVPFEQVAEDMKEVPLLEAQAVANFFYRVWIAFLESMPDFLGEQIQKMTPERRHQWIPVLQAVGGGSSALLR